MQASIDHLVFTAPDLKMGMDKVEKQLGVRPVMGGRHPDFGTHNALLSLGQSTYLEIIAPDPGLAAPERGRLFEQFYERGPRLTNWVLRVEDIARAREKAVQRGLGLGPIQSGQRQKPDGSLLTWKLTDPYALPMEGAIPFLIHWGDTPHPAQSLPGAGALLELKIEHPDPEFLKQKLQGFDTPVHILTGREVRLKAKIKTPDGRTVELQ